MRSLILFLSILVLSGCNAPDLKKSEKQAAGQAPAPLTVYYFHSAYRCPTCISIEKNTLKVLNDYFSDRVASGEIAFQAVRADEAQNKALVEKYQAYGSSLHIVRTKDGKETDSDLTRLAFSYSLGQPEKFINILLDTISSQLK